MIMKPFSEITFADIADLVKRRVSENEYLDYKRQYEGVKDVANLVSAFANTFGGWIVFGVEEYGDSNRPRCVRSLVTDDKVIEHSFDSMCFDSISPPVFCDRKMLYGPKKKKVFLVRVPESDIAPHGVDNNTKWYVKIKSQKKPFDAYTYANGERLEWLRLRRAKYEQFFAQIMESAESRISEYLDAFVPYSYVLEIRGCPRFPRERLATYGNLEDLAGQCLAQLNACGQTLLNIRGSEHYNGGIIKRNIRGSIKYYLDMSSYGLYILRLYTVVDNGGDADRRYVPFDNMAINLLHGLHLAKYFYTTIGYGGSVVMQLRLMGAKKSLLSKYDCLGNSVVFPNMGQRSLEDYVSLRTTSQSGLTADDLRNAFSQLIADILFVYGASGDLFESASRHYDGIAKSYKFAESGN